MGTGKHEKLPDCWDCDGEGEKIEIIQNGSTRAKTVECGTCQGTGKLGPSI